MPLAEQHRSLHCEVQAVTCALWLCSWMCSTGKQSSQEAALDRGTQAGSGPFFSCFLDLASIAFLTLLCAPHIYPLLSFLGGNLQCLPRQALLCHVQLIRTAIRTPCHPGVWLILHHCFGLPLPFSSAIGAAGAALRGLFNSPHFSLISFALSLPAFLDCGVVKQHCFSHVSKGMR